VATTSDEAEALQLARGIVDLLDEKKGEEILLLDLVGVCSFTDYFVLCSASSERTLQALADAIHERVKVELGAAAGHVEGKAESGWLLLDYGGVVVHLLSPEMRRYYRLEDLWRAGRVLVRIA
jgi:ribosome-associated protein